MNLLLTFFKNGLPKWIAAACVSISLTACAVEQPFHPSDITPEGERISRQAESTLGVATPLLVTLLPPVKNSGLGHPHLIRVGDLLEVDVYLEDSLDKTVRVDRTGQVVLPLIGTVRAAGKTIQGFARTLERKYSGSQLQDPEITVFIAETEEPKIIVDGAVENPGLYGVNDKTTLLEVIASVGGFDDEADPRYVYIFRDYEGRKLVANYSVTAIREAKLADPRVYEGDTIVAFRSGTKVSLKNLGTALGIAAVLTTITRD